MPTKAQNLPVLLRGFLATARPYNSSAVEYLLTLSNPKMCLRQSTHKTRRGAPTGEGSSQRNREKHDRPWIVRGTNEQPEPSR